MKRIAFCFILFFVLTYSSIAQFQKNLEKAKKYELNANYALAIDFYQDAQNSTDKPDSIEIVKNIDFCIKQLALKTKQLEQDKIASDKLLEITQKNNDRTAELLKYSIVSLMDIKDSFDIVKNLNEKLNDSLIRISNKLENYEAKYLESLSLLVETENQLWVSDSILSEAESTIDNLYFYENQFGLAYQGKYGYIDKKGNLKIAYKYRNAQVFDMLTGYAKVEIDSNKYLIDTLENKYLLAEKIEDLNPNIEALDLRNCGLNEIPAEVFENTQLRILILEDNHIKKLPSAIAKLENLILLDLSNNLLEELPLDIGLLKDLQVLNLNRNENIEKLPASIIYLTKLRKLFLSWNNFTKLPPKIEYLPNLTELDLSWNSIKILSGKIGNLKNLRKLYLSWNKLENLPQEIGQLENLEILIVGANQLSSLPITIGNLKNLRELNASWNNLAEIPAEIGQVRNLRKLDLYKNRILILPDEIGNLSQLTDLDLRWNSLLFLPTEIGNLSNLKSLNLYNNQLFTLCPEIGKLKKLQSLDLYENNLIELPSEIGNLKNLKYLSLWSNHLNKLPHEIGNLRNLTYLNLWSNNISELPVEIGKLINLRELILSNNKIVHLPKEVGELRHLDQLLISANNLEDLPHEIGNLQKLKKLHLISNNISRLPPEIAKLSNLVEFYPSGNPISYIAPEISELKMLDAKSLLIIANQLFNMKEYKRALAFFEKTILKNPDELLAFSKIAIIYILNNEYYKAEIIYNQQKNKLDKNTGLSFAEYFLFELKQVEKSGISHYDFNKARESFK